MKRLLKNLGVTTAVAAFAVAPVGLVSAQSGDIDTTGPDSTNKIDFRNDSRFKVHNDNRLSATNNNPQTATTGDVKIQRNTEGGDGESGAASNDSYLAVTANVDNSGSGEAACGCANGNGGDSTASITKTGPDSYNKVVFRNTSSVEVRNNNNISVTNNNAQTATSGNVEVSRNTEAGNGTSGDASNISTTTIDLSVSN